MCDHISADVEALQPLHAANEGGDGGDVVASHIEGLQTRKECYLYREAPTCNNRYGLVDIVYSQPMYACYCNCIIMAA